MSNTFSCIGNLTRDAETKTLPSMQSVTNFTIANNVWANKEKSAIYISCALFGKRGEALSPYLKKGQKVFISGEMSTREYKGRDGLNKTALELNVLSIDLAGSPPSREPGIDDDIGGEDHAFDDDFDDSIPI